MLKWADDTLKGLCMELHGYERKLIVWATRITELPDFPSNRPS